MMTQLRERTAIIMWVVILAFIGLIVVEWGADYSGTSGRGSDVVGVINGESISLSYFRQALQNAAQQRSRDDRYDDGYLVREVWDALVGSAIVRQELERLGISISDTELAFYTRNQPPPAVRQIEAFQTDGEFDATKYQLFLTDSNTYRDERSKAFVMQIEGLLQNQLINHRLQRILMETVQVSPPAVRQYYQDKNQKVTVEYVFSSARAIDDEEVSFTEAELETHYDELTAQFHHGDEVRLQYAFFARQASAADSLAVAAEARSLLDDLADGSDFAELARVMSEDQATAASGGDLGTFGRGRMVLPFDDAVFALEEGQVSEPVQTPFGWHVIKLEERTETEDGPQVRARHILLKIRPSPDTEDSIFKDAQAFQTLAVERGFEAAAGIDGVQVRDIGWHERDKPVRGLGPGSSWIVNTLFDNEPGYVAPVASLERGYWVAFLSDRRAEGASPLPEIRQRVERSLKDRKKAELVGARLQPIRDKVLQGATLASAAEQDGLELRTTEPFARMDNVPGIGRANAFIGAAVRLEAGGLSEITTASGGAYLLRVTDKTPFDEETFQAARAEVERELLRQRQTEAMQVWFTQIYDSAQIEDNRHLNYRF